MGVGHKNTECGINEGMKNEREYKVSTQQAFLKADLNEIPAKHVNVHAKL